MAKLNSLLLMGHPLRVRIVDIAYISRTGRSFNFIKRKYSTTMRKKNHSAKLNSFDNSIF